MFRLVLETLPSRGPTRCLGERATPRKQGLVFGVVARRRFFGRGGWGTEVLPESLPLGGLSNLGIPRRVR